MPNVTKPQTTSQWILKRPKPEEARALASQLMVSPIVAQIMLNREIGDIAAMRAYLRPDTSQLSSPYELGGMEAAVSRILSAREKDEKVLIHGDYDVDGITSASILSLLLKGMDIKVEAYLPDRFKDGYGLRIPTLERIKVEEYGVVITTDCGITALEEARWLQKQGIDLIVVDHHELADELPVAAALVHPRIPIEGKEVSYGNLCAAGTALKLALALIEKDSHARFVAKKIMPDLLMLAAIGTVCDVMPLTGENRVLVDAAFRVIPGITQPGLKQIIENITHRGTKKGKKATPKSLTAGNIGFQIGPRINAGGRMGNTRLGYDLFTTIDAARAKTILADLEQENARRQDTEKEITLKAHEQAGTIVTPQSKSLVVAGVGWHEGVIGIVASRLVEAHYLPTVVIAFDGAWGKASCRSVEGCDIHKALADCAHLLKEFGGHPMAAGLSIHESKLMEFRSAFEEACAKQLDKRPQRNLAIDVACPPEHIDLRLLQSFKQLEPFGVKNPKPTFALKNVAVAGVPRTLGQDGQHLTFYIKGNGTSFKAIGWSMAPYMELVSSGRPFSILFSPSINHFNGTSSIQFEIKEIREEKG